MDSILNAIQEGRWEDALRDFLDYSEKNELNDEGCILGATILEQFGEAESMYSLIIRGLKVNPFNYELYLLLGNYYRDQNPNWAYLSYEQALYYALKQGQDADADQIREIINDYSSAAEVSVRNTTVLIIEDLNREHLKECRHSVEQTCFGETTAVVVTQTDENTGVPGAVNRALKEIGSDDDVMIISSDVILMPNSLYLLRMGLYSDDTTGACGPSCNLTPLKKEIQRDESLDSIEKAVEYAMGNNIPENMVCEVRPALDMNYVLLSRKALDLITPLNEIITVGEYQIIELCLTIIQKGLKNKTCWNSFVYRFGPVSKYTKEYAERFYNEKAIVKKKWGFDPGYYFGARKDLIALIAEPEEASISVLEVGCGLGTTLSCIRSQFPNSKVRGIEIVENVAEVGKRIADIECANIESYEFGPNEKYDYILFGDVLEHLIDPYSLIQNLREHLNDGGCILASIPNIMNAGVVYELLHGNFTYRDSGILDRTHMRFFTRKEIVKMFSDKGYNLEVAVASNSIGNSTMAHPEFWDKLLAIEGVSPRSEFDAFQYIFRARKV